MKYIVHGLLIILIVLLLVRVGPRVIGSVFALLIRLWYITIPVLLVLWFYLRQRLKYQAKKRHQSNLDPDLEVKVDQDKEA